MIIICPATEGMDGLGFSRHASDDVELHNRDTCIQNGRLVVCHNAFVLLSLRRPVLSSQSGAHLPRHHLASWQPTSLTLSRTALDCSHHT